MTKVQREAWSHVKPKHSGSYIFWTVSLASAVMVEDFLISKILLQMDPTTNNETDMTIILITQQWKTVCGKETNFL